MATAKIKRKPRLSKIESYKALRFLFHFLADHIIHRFLSDAGQVGHLRGVVEQSSIGVGDFALLRCGEFVLFCAVSVY